jgi:hypothetical protein
VPPARMVVVLDLTRATPGVYSIGCISMKSHRAYTHAPVPDPGSSRGTRRFCITRSNRRSLNEGEPVPLEVTFALIRRILAYHSI